MKRNFVLLLGALLLVLSCSKKDDVTAKGKKKVKGYNRIVSLAPSITETLFLLGAGERVVGVTTFSNYPEKVKEISKVGSYLDTNYELMVTMKPDLVFLLPSHLKAKENLERLGIETFLLSQRNIADIISSFELAGGKLGLAARGKFVADSLSREVSEAKKLNSAAGAEKQKMLISIGRDFSGEISHVYAGGKGTFFDDIISILDCENASDTKVAYPKISLEGILKLNPDIVVDLIPELYEMSLEEHLISAKWKKLKTLNAVKKDKIIIEGGRYVSIPGPRIIGLIRNIAGKM